MNKFILFIVTVLVSIIAKAQVSESRFVEDFTKLKVSTGIDVTYTISDTKTVNVTTDDAERMQCVKTEVNKGFLEIFIETKSVKDKNKYNFDGFRNKINGVPFKVLKVEITGPALSQFQATSSADIKVINTNKSDNLDIKASSGGSISGNFVCTKLEVDASSSGNFNAEINADEIEIECSSSADIKLTGKAKTVDVDASSSADCNLKNLHAENVEVEASSSADVTVYASKSINASASSSADIVYYGNPSQKSVKESSSGDVTGK